MNRIVNSIVLAWLTRTGATADVTYHNARESAERIHGVLRGVLIFTLCTIVICFVFNLFGWLYLNLAICFMFMVVCAIMGTTPGILSGAATVGSTIGLVRNGNFTDETMKILKGYGVAFGNTMFWGSFILFILGTLPFKENPWAVLTLSTGAILFGLISTVLGIGMGRWKHLVFAYVLVFFLASALSLVPSATFVKYFGIDPKVSFFASKTEKALAKAEEAERKTKDNWEAWKLEKIAEKFEKGEALTIEEKQLYTAQQIKRDKNTIPGKISGLFSGKGKTAGNIKPSFEPMPWGNHPITLKSGEEYGWIRIPDYADWDISPTKNGHWTLTPYNGKIITYKPEEKQYVSFSKDDKIFKVKNLGEETMTFILVVKKRG